ncbi:TPA: glycosyltransferase [Clostridium perfringens]|nr:glycosyltransferase [Clostridium perfringens]HAT4126727.1 glycosyltransferase [Clostridium perfringens]
MNLSFVIIGKNEANNIEKCIFSIVNNCNLKDYEIIFIDSNSSDNTLEILNRKEFSFVKKFKLKSNIYSAALARDVGARLAKGNFLFFIDADMQIEEDSNIDWCINLFNDKNMGIVSGELNEVWLKNKLVINKIFNIFNVKSENDDLKSPGGYFITKKEYYKEVGGFDITLKCNEEVNLFSRYKKINKKLIRTNKLSCLHNNEKDSVNKSHLSRFKSKYYAHFWRAIFKSIKGSYLKEYLSFSAQIRMIRSIIITFFMMITIFISFKNILFMIIPILYYFLLIVKYKYNVKLMLSNQLNSILVLFSLIFSFKKINIKYEIFEV